MIAVALPEKTLIDWNRHGLDVIIQADSVVPARPSLLAAFAFVADGVSPSSVGYRATARTWRRQERRRLGGLSLLRAQAKPACTRSTVPPILDSLHLLFARYQLLARTSNSVVVGTRMARRARNSFRELIPLSFSLMVYRRHRACRGIVVVPSGLQRPSVRVKVHHQRHHVERTWR